MLVSWAKDGTSFTNRADSSKIDTSVVREPGTEGMAPDRLCTVVRLLGLVKEHLAGKL